MTDDLQIDTLKVVRAYLYEHDPTALDEEFVRELGFIPDEVQDAGEEYAKAQEEFNRAKSKRDQKKEGLIELMVEHEVKRFPYRDGKKVFELDETQTVKIKKRTVDGSDDSDGPTAFDKEQEVE